MTSTGDFKKDCEAYHSFSHFPPPVAAPFTLYHLFLEAFCKSPFLGKVQNYTKCLQNRVKTERIWRSADFTGGTFF